MKAAIVILALVVLFMLFAALTFDVTIFEDGSFIVSGCLPFNLCSL